MSQSVSTAFIRQYETDVHLAYQRMGTKLRSTVRTTTITGEQTTFQKAGKGIAQQKTRHGMVPVMNVEHTNVDCPTSDWYAGDWVDKLDENKINIDEKQVLANSGAYALGRKTDDLIITAAKTTTTEVGDYSTGFTKNLLLSAFEKLNDGDVPDDGQRFGVVGAHQWNELLNIDEFASSDFAGSMYPWLAGAESRKWLGIVWIMHTGLPLETANRDCFLYHRSAVGHAIGADITADITWHGDRAAHFINNMMTQGSCLIDTAGVVKIKCDDTAAIA